jgi:hypothetical protein
MLVVFLAACAGIALVPIDHLSGDVTWTLSFDDTAHASGLTDCSYTRHYEGDEDLSAPWLCPTCDAQYPATVSMSAEDQACYGQIDPEPYSPAEILGWAGDAWYRGFAVNYLLVEQGTAVVTPTSVSTSNASDWADLGEPGEGQYALRIDGTLARTRVPGDLVHGFTAPDSYACGWPKADLPAYTGNYDLHVGKLLPDGVFRDRCADPVRLWDLTGTWLVIEVSAMDCGPCQDAADGEAAFLAQQDAAGVPTTVVTMLSPSLGAPNEEPTIDDLQAWSSVFHEDGSPVLADRGWGLWLGIGALADRFAYPTFIVVDPDRKVVATLVGFGGWDAVGAKTHD